MSSNIIGICNENVTVRKVEKAKDEYMIEMKSVATIKSQQNREIVITLHITGSLKISQIGLQIIIN